MSKVPVIVAFMIATFFSATAYAGMAPDQSDFVVLPSIQFHDPEQVQDFIEEVHFQVLLNLDQDKKFFAERDLVPFQVTLVSMYLHHSLKDPINSSLVADYIVTQANLGVSYDKIVEGLVDMYKGKPGVEKSL